VQSSTAACNACSDPGGELPINACPGPSAESRSGLAQGEK
jgi:hypothetical protein